MKHIKLFIISLLSLTLLFTFGCSKNEDKQSTETPVSQSENSTETENSQEAPRKKYKVEVEDKEEVVNIKVTDIDKHPAEKEIVKLIESGAVEIAADGKFRPNELITRGEFLSWTYNYDNKGIKPHHPKTPSYSDLSKDHKYYDIIEGMTAAGLTVGYPDGTFKADKELTREELALLWAYYKKASLILEPVFPVSTKESLIEYNQDGKEVGAQFVYAVAGYSKQRREVFGDNLKIMPQQGVTRAEAAQWIVKFAE